MARYKRQMWTSGYTYRQACPYCGTVVEYTDNQLGYRSWFPNGFVYCPRCRKPLRHNEIYALKPDGTPVYSTQIEADVAIREGYYSTVGVPYAPGNLNQPPAPPASAPSPAADGSPKCFCNQCGREFTPGIDHFCPSCGNRLD